MIQVQIYIRKSAVYHDVGMTTAYLGSKALSDKAPTSYERIATTDEDRHLLERFWVEASSLVSDMIRPFAVDINPQPDSHGVEIERDYRASLELPPRYNEQLTDSIISGLHSFFVEFVVGKWLTLISHQDGALYLQTAQTILDEAKRKLHYRKRPTRDQ